MIKIILLTSLLIANFSVFSQILPSYQSTHIKKSSGGSSSFSVDPSTKGNEIVLSNNNKTVGSTKSSSGNSCNWEGVYLLPTMSLGTGTHSVEFTVDAYSNQAGNIYDMTIGVTINNDKGQTYPFYNASKSLRNFGYIAENGMKYGSLCSPGNDFHISYGATYGQDDRVKVEFNTDNKTLIFYKNDASQGVAYSGGSCFANVTFHFSVGICNENFAVSITG